MIIGFLVVLIVILSVGVWHNGHGWGREQAARERIHQARIRDNDQRAVDNERWAERVQQARQLGYQAGLKAATGEMVNVVDAFQAAHRLAVLGYMERHCGAQVVNQRELIEDMAKHYLDLVSQ